MNVNPSQIKPRIVLLAVLTGALLVFGLASGVGIDVTLAANNSTTTLPPYYENASNTSGQGPWMAGHENVTLANVTHYISRIQGFVVGSGYAAQGGVGSAGALMTGGFVMLLFIGIGVGTRVGTPAGAAMGVSSLFVLGELGLVPSWLYATTLFIFGVLYAAVIIRSQR